MSLCLHAGAQRINRDQLAALPMPAPMGSRHAIRPFAEDVELVDMYLRRNGLVITEEAFGVQMVDNLPTKFFGVLEVQRALEGEYIPAKGYSLNIGLRGAYDQSFQRALAVGSRVFVCDNLAFSGDITVGTRQTTNIGDRLPAMLERACAQIPLMSEAQDRRFDAYKGHTLRARHGDAALVEMVRLGVLNPSQIGKAISEWDEPSHAEHGRNTVWTLMQAITEAIKPTAERNAIPATWQRTVAMTGFLDSIVGHG